MTTLNCKLYVDGDTSRERLAVDLQSVLTGTRTGFTFATPLLEAHVQSNDKFHRWNRAQEDDGHLFSRFHLEVEPAAGAERDAYVKAVGDVLLGLRGRGWRVTADCEFEAELPHPPDA